MSQVPGCLNLTKNKWEILGELTVIELSHHLRLIVPSHSHST